MPPALTFAQMFESYFVFVWRTARRLGVPEPHLDDVAQERPSQRTAHRRREDFEGASALKTWLYGIAFNVVRAHRRELGAKDPAALNAEQRAPIRVCSPTAPMARKNRLPSERLPASSMAACDS